MTPPIKPLLPGIFGALRYYGVGIANTRGACTGKMVITILKQAYSRF
jgi:hypothetical protein